MRKLTKEEINESLSHRNLFLIGDYVNGGKPTTFRCSFGHEWEAYPNTVRQGSGCPFCVGLAKHTVESINSILKKHNNGISMVGDYINNYTKTTFKCSKNHTWDSRPGHIIKGSGCPSCAEYGFKPNKPAWVYVIIFQNYLKYGITHSLKRRLWAHKKNGEYELVFSKFYETGEKAIEWEKKIKNSYGGNYVTKDQCPDGYTETLPLSLLNDIILSHETIL